MSKTISYNALVYKIHHIDSENRLRGKNFFKYIIKPIEKYCKKIGGFFLTINSHYYDNRSMSIVIISQENFINPSEVIKLKIGKKVYARRWYNFSSFGNTEKEIMLPIIPIVKNNLEEKPESYLMGIKIKNNQDGELYLEFIKGLIFIEDVSYGVISDSLIMSSLELHMENKITLIKNY